MGADQLHSYTWKAKNSQARVAKPAAKAVAHALRVRRYARRAKSQVNQMPKDS